ncbi:MAG: STAS domain-containing protein [Bryobacteraceae bacterium]
MSTSAQSSEAPLKLHTYPKGNTIVVECSGKLLSNVSSVFHSEIKALFPQTKCIVLDLTNLVQMDSAGLGAIAGLYIAGKGAGVRIQLINLSKRIRELLSLTHILALFEPVGEHCIRID